MPEPAAASSEADREGWAGAAAAGETVAGGLAAVAAFLGALPSTPDHRAAGAAAARLMLASDWGAGHQSEASECRSCPVCRLLAAARTVAPDVVDAIEEALDALVAAIAEEFEPTEERSTTWD